MRSLWRVLVLMVTLVVLLAPAVYAADPPVFYASDKAIPTSTGNPDGSGQNPVIAANAQAMRDACTAFEKELAVGQTATVYWVRLAKNQYYEYTLTEGSPECKTVGLGTAIDGQPPDFGVAVTSPLIVGGLAALGVLLIGAAWWLRRRLRTSPRSA